MRCRFVNGNFYNRINRSIRFVSFLVAVCLPPKMSQKRTFYTRCVSHADILDRVCFSYQYFRQGSTFVFRKILDRVGFQHQVGTYPYENDRSIPPGEPKPMILSSSPFKSDPLPQENMVSIIFSRN